MDHRLIALWIIPSDLRQFLGYGIDLKLKIFRRGWTTTFFAQSKQTKHLLLLLLTHQLPPDKGEVGRKMNLSHQ
jgi:hypothetical protein